MHHFLIFLGKLPQFQSASMHGTVIDMRTGCHVTKFDGGDEPKYRNALQLWWPGVEKDAVFPFDGEKYIRLQAYDAARLTGDDSYLRDVTDVLLK
jgi:hypothetical protein